MTIRSRAYVQLKFHQITYIITEGRQKGERIRGKSHLTFGGSVFRNVTPLPPPLPP